MGRTKAHKNAHPPSKAPELSPRQAMAAALVATGKTDQDTAAAIGVRRECVTRWKRSLYFRAEVDARRQELWGAATDRLRAMVPKALDVLEARLADGDKSAALEVLKAVKLYGEVGPPTPAPVDGLQALEDAAMVKATGEAFQAHDPEWIVNRLETADRRDTYMVMMHREAMADLDDSEPADPEPEEAPA